MQTPFCFAAGLEFVSLSVLVLEPVAVRRLFGALPQIAMLHHRRARRRVWSANISVQLCPSHAFTSEKSSSQTNFASASPIGSSKDSATASAASSQFEAIAVAVAMRDIWLNASSRSRSRVQRRQFAQRLGRQRPAHMLAHEASEPLAQRTRLIGHLVQFTGIARAFNSSSASAGTSLA